MHPCKRRLRTAARRRSALLAALLAAVAIVLPAVACGAERVLVAAAADLKFALEEMAARAAAIGAHAVVGMDLDYEVVGQGGSMLMVSASGTAVTFE